MPDDPHDAPDNETPGQRRVRLMNLTNEKWDPNQVEVPVDEVPSPELSVIDEVHAEPKPAAGFEPDAVIEAVTPDDFRKAAQSSKQPAKGK